MISSENFRVKQVWDLRQNLSTNFRRKRKDEKTRKKNLLNLQDNSRLVRIN